MKNYTYVFYVFLKIQKHDFLRFFELLHTFSRTLNSVLYYLIPFCNACLDMYVKQAMELRVLLYSN